MADDKKLKSFADRYDAIKAENKENYNQAAQGKESAQQAQGVDSQQVKDDKPKLEYNMKGPGAQEVTNQTHKANMAKDDQAAKADKYVDRANTIKNSNSSTDNVNSKDENSRN